MHKFNPAHIDRLLSEERHRELPPGEFLASVGLAPGDRLADIGCGPGFFTLPAAKIVGPGGRVYALDTQAEMLEELKKRVCTDNVVPMLTEESVLPLPDGAVDMALVVHVLHEAADMPGFLREIHRVLAPGGRLVLVDWIRQAEDRGPPEQERVSEAEAIEAAGLAGFASVKAAPLTASHYKLTGIKAG